MNCKNCNRPLSDESRFCPECGCAVEQEKPKCQNCQADLRPGAAYCAVCGWKVPGVSPRNIVPTNSESQNPGEAKPKAFGKAKNSYIASVLSAILTLLIRIQGQTEQKLYVSSFNFRWALGLDADWKPFYSLIPIAAGIIAALIVTSDKKATTQKKTTILLINAIFIVLSFVFIWFDIPRDLFDF